MKKKIILLIVVVFMCCMSAGLLYFVSLPMIQFINKEATIEINETLDASQYIQATHRCDKKDIYIDTSQVKMNQIGTYPLVYKVKDKEYSINLKVVDTQPPIIETNDIEKDLGEAINIEDVVVSIQDDTPTKTYWKEDYDFTKEGLQEVIVVVEDEAGNCSEKSVKINLIKDDEKPTLIGLKDITVYKNDKVDYLKGITAKDNRDENPTIKVDDSQVNLSKIGTYQVKYTVKDKAGNQNTYTKTVTVIEKRSISSVQPNGNKVVYLTFDDGPSLNTKKILDILDKYNAKATFFVTGNGQNYNYLIKEAYQRGHTIGLHTYSHNYSQVYASVDAYFDDLNKVGHMVEEQIGFVPKYIRFPGGASNTVSKNYCPGIMTILTSEVQNRGYQYYDWNVSSEDASGNNIPVSQIVKASTSSQANNIMLLAHDIQSKSTTVEALPQIIEYYQNLGYTFKGIDDSAFTPHHHVNN